MRVFWLSQEKPSLVHGSPGAQEKHEGSENKPFITLQNDRMTTPSMKETYEGTESQRRSAGGGLGFNSRERHPEMSSVNMTVTVRHASMGASQDPRE